MKTTANSIAYGTGIEMNVVEHRRPVEVSIHLPDGTSYADRAERTEQPGSYFNPLLATLVTGGGRLLLAAAMSLVMKPEVSTPTATPTAFSSSPPKMGGLCLVEADPSGRPTVAKQSTA